MHAVLHTSCSTEAGGDDALNDLLFLTLWEQLLCDILRLERGPSPRLQCDKDCFLRFLNFPLDKSHNLLSSVTSMPSAKDCQSLGYCIFGEPGTAYLLGLSFPRQLPDQSLGPLSPRVTLYNISIY